MNRDRIINLSLRGISLVMIFLGLLFASLCLPLILGDVAPNSAYGIRTADAFRSSENWYFVNRTGGFWLLSASGLICVLGAVGCVVPRHRLVRYLGAAGVAAIIILAATIWRIVQL